MRKVMACLRVAQPRCAPLAVPSTRFLLRFAPVLRLTACSTGIPQGHARLTSLGHGTRESVMTRLLTIAAASGLLALASGASACEWHKTTAGLATDSMARAAPQATAAPAPAPAGAEASKIIGNGSPMMSSRPSLDATLVSDQLVSVPRQ